MKLRSLAAVVSFASLLTGCPENTYPAGDKDAYPPTADSVFRRKGDEHDKAEGFRKVVADEGAKPADRQAAATALVEQAKKEKEEQDSIEKARPAMGAILAVMFGSPEHPSRPGGVPNKTIDVAKIFANLTALQQIQEPGSPLESGRQLYKLHCMHCHGFYGYGDGPTANFLYPRPRDFRYGLVKFTSTKGGFRPVHDDLVRPIAQGVQGTMMPAFGPHEGVPSVGIFAGHAGPPGFDVDAVASYIEVLLMRGSVERQLAAKWADDGELTAANAQSAVDQMLAEWQTANDNVVKPEGTHASLADFQASARKGAVLYGAPVAGTEKDPSFGKAGCVKCHGLHGLGVDSPPSDGALDTKSLNDFGLPAAPMNLTMGLYRGGRRPIDLYRRIFAGIKGTPMPGQAGNLTPDEIWNVVDYVYQLGMPKSE